MRKLVNGKVVEVSNIELFELAAEGLALQNTAVSATSDGLEGNINSALVRKYIKQYDVFFQYMPYPLYAIEDDIKYATLGNFIKSLAKEELTMWVDKGLYIKLDDQTGMTLKVVNNTWSIVYVKNNMTDNTSMELFKHSVGYAEYTWILKKITNRESTSNFYMEFMPEFVKACNGQAMVLKWELENILTFGTIPNRMEFKQNKILDINDEVEYSLDIYCTGTVDTDEEVQSLVLGRSGMSTGVSKKQIKTYGFDAYNKSLSDSGNSSKNSGKIEKCKITGLHNLFMELCGFKSANAMSKFPDFTGAMFDNNMVFTIDKRLYFTKSNRLMEPKVIAHGAEIYAIENNKIYFTKSKKISDRVSKDTLYSYSIRDNAIRLCKIIFTY